MSLKMMIICLIISGCTNIATKIEENKNYRLDIVIKSKNPDREDIGMAVLKDKALHTIEFEAPAKISYISFKTCSREIVEEDPSSGLSRKKFKINYRPNEIEKAGSCIAMVSAYNDKNMYSVGFIDFEDETTTMGAVNICGENSSMNEGVSVCQGRVGSIEKIRFEVETIVSADEGCELDSSRGFEYTYFIKKGFCVYAFMNKNNPEKIHRLTTYGYDDIQIK